MRNFTLIEVLAVLVISSTLLASLLTIFGQVMSLRDNFAATASTEVVERRVINILRSDLENIALPGSTFTTDFTAEEEGTDDQRTDTVEYSTFNSDTVTGGEVVQVTLKVEEDEDGNLCLLRYAQENLLVSVMEEPDPQVLLRGIKSFSCITYSDDAWDDGYSTEDELPEAIQFDIVVDDDREITLLVPVKTEKLEEESGQEGNNAEE